MKTTRLALVMFTEISDFARMTSENEGRAIELLREYQAIVTPLIADNGGKIVDQDAGGMLILFESVLAGSQCALLMQFSLRARNNHADGNFKILPRIGLHLGDIWQEGERVYGNGINIASRVMNKARPGGICVSDDVYRQLVNKMEVEFTELYDADLKNISRALALFELATGCETGEAPEKPPAADGDTGSKMPHPELPPVPEAPLIPEESPEPASAMPESVGAIGDLSKGLGILTQQLVKKSLENAMIEMKQDSGQIQVNINRHTESGEPALHKRRDRNHPARRLEELIKKNKSSSGALATGIVISAGFGAGLYFLPSKWWWIGITIGLITTLAGFFDTIGSHRELRRIRKQMPKLIQDAILGYGGKSGGRMSVADAAAATRFSLDEVKAELEAMADKGFVVRETDEDGLVSYRFAGRKKTLR